MKIYSIHDLANCKALKILESGLTVIADERIITNYHPDYKNNPANLFYLLKHGRYTVGKYFIITDDQDQFIASAGWNRYDNEIALCLTRMYVSPKFRSKFIVGNVLLPSIIDETVNYKKLWMTVNDYNKSLYDWFVRCQDVNSIGNWPGVYKKFKPIGQQTVNYTLQYVVEYDKSKKDN